MIDVKNLTKTFDGFKALDDVTLHVEKGSVYGLMGPNGAGKTTLLLNIVDTLIPDSGEVRLNNLPVRDNPEAKKNMVFIPDEVFYFANSTPLSLMSYYKGIYPQFDTALFFSLKDLFSEINLAKPIRKMSKGMKKQVAFWISICCKPEILILDEPVDGLDPVMRHNIWQLLLSRISAEKMTVLVSSHNLRELEDVCDHIGIMDHGKIILQESLDEIQNNIFKVQLAFDGEFPIPEDELNIKSRKQNGKITEIIVSGNKDETLDIINKYDPLICDIIPMTLEEIFIYEIGGQDSEITKLLTP